MLKSVFEEYGKYLVYGRERGKKGTFHLQGQIVLKNPRAFAGIRRLLGTRAHIEPTKDLQASIDYCKKDGDFVEMGVIPITPVAKGEKQKVFWSDQRKLIENGQFELIDPRVYITHARTIEFIRQKYLRRQALSETEEKMYWYCGDTGAGKSRAARDRWMTKPGGFFIKMTNKWWDGYDNEETVLIEDVDPTRCSSMAQYFKIWMDRYPFAMETKGGGTCIRPKRVIVTSNYLIHECFPNPQDYLPMYRRCDVELFRIGKEPEVIHYRGDDPDMQHLQERMYGAKIFGTVSQPPILESKVSESSND